MTLAAFSLAASSVLGLGLLFATPPAIEPLDVLASKLPG